MPGSTEAAAAATEPTTLEGLAARPELRAVLLEHATRGLRVQVILRAVLVIVVVLVLAFVPPARNGLACWVVAACYLAWAVLTAAVAVGRPGETALRSAWLALFGDVAALAVLAVLASASDAESWTSDVLLNAFFVVPLLAATQLRPWIGVLVGLPTVAVYTVAGAVARSANDEPWTSVVLRSVVLAGLFAGCVLLSRVQRSRVVTIGGLASERSRLLAETIAIETRERRSLAEGLHDGALQYLLAARHDLADAQQTGDPTSFARVAEALQLSAGLLRSTMTELHPAVLQQSGVAAALRELVAATTARSGLDVDLDTNGWLPAAPTPADPVLFGAARELLGNVVKHAHARHVRVTLASADGRARLTVVDDGVGLDPTALAARLGEGHIGVASQRSRVAAAGGSFTLQPAQPRGTVAAVTVPLTAVLA